MICEFQTTLDNIVIKFMIDTLHTDKIGNGEQAKDLLLLRFLKTIFRYSEKKLMIVV